MRMEKAERVPAVATIAQHEVELNASLRHIIIVLVRRAVRLMSTSARRCRRRCEGSFRRATSCFDLRSSGAAPTSLLGTTALTAEKRNASSTRRSTRNVQRPPHSGRGENHRRRSTSALSEIVWKSRRDEVKRLTRSSWEYVRRSG